MASSSSATTFKSLALFFVVFVFATVASAQDGFSPAPAAGPNAGAAGSVSGSVAMIGASLVLSMLAVLKY